jgi:hypothetical protein
VLRERDVRVRGERKERERRGRGERKEFEKEKREKEVRERRERERGEIQERSSCLRQSEMLSNRMCEIHKTFTFICIFI